MPLFGSHLSIAGGYFKAVEAASRLGMDTVQIFTKNNNQWTGKPILADDIERFQAALKQANICQPISHDSYLINLASPDNALWRRSIDAMVIELERAASLGILDVVAHPGSHVGSGEEVGLDRIAEALMLVLERTKALPTRIALETTAGQGTNLGHRFEHLGGILQRLGRPDRITVCMDSCHIFAAGYPLAPKKAFKETIRQFDELIGLDRLVAWHVNDSKREQGSRVDRHEHIGHGHIGLEAFALLVNEPAFRRLPLYLETAKEVDSKTGQDWDAINLATLRSLLAQKGNSKKSP